MQNNEITIFNHVKFGEVRAVVIDGKEYLVGVDVAKPLGYTKPSKAVADHVDKRDLLFLSYQQLQYFNVQKPQMGNFKIPTRGLNVINESGVYALILASKLESAQDFKHWVTSEVLPTLRKTGSYSMKPQQIEEHTTTINAKKLVIKAKNVNVENLNVTSPVEKDDTPKQRIVKDGVSKRCPTKRKGEYRMTDLKDLTELLIPYADYLGAKRDRKAGADMYTCPLCHSGEHGTGSTGAFHIGRNKNGKLSYYCHSCGSGGNIIDMYCQYHGISNTRDNFPEVIKGLKSELGIPNDDYEGFKKSYQYHSPVEQSDLNPSTIVEQKDRTKFFNKALMGQPKAIEYLKQRKIVHAESIAQHFQIGYTDNFAYEWENGKPSKTTPAVIIPTSDYSFAWRSTTENLKKKSGAVVPLNLGCLSSAVKWVFLVEGEFDLFSILDITDDVQNCEFSAISVNSAGNLPRFIDTYIANAIQEDMGLIIALDSDQFTNPNVKQFVDKGLQTAMRHRIPCVLADVQSLYLGTKDANDALKKDRQAFTDALQSEVEKAKTLDIPKYLEDCKALDVPETQPPTDRVKTYSFDYIGQIDRAFDLSHESLRYCHQNKSWYCFDGVRLQQDKTQKFIDTLHSDINEQCLEELTYYQSKDNSELLKCAKKEHKYAISKVGLLNAVEGIRKREPIAITLLELDKPNLLNCENITLNLKTLEPHPHRIEDLCTKLANSLYGVELNQKCVAFWNQFILDIMNGDPNMAEFLQRVCGYTLFPYNKEECFFIFYGATTRNGKSTLLESIKLALGDYAKAVSSATLSERPTGKEANPEIISLVGAKLIICGELNSETLLNDTLLKSWIGNDTISARNLFSNDILNFKIDGKLYANCNELPPMKNDDLLNSHRIIVVPFDRHFEEHEQNKNLKKLFATSEFKAVIMAWLVEGYKRYLQLGIKANMPERVKQAIENYQSEANSINVFLSDEDVFERIDFRNYEDAVKVTDKRLYSAYVDWCKDNNCRALSSANFKKQLRKNKNYGDDKIRDGVRYTQILMSYKLRPALTVTDMSQPDNPDRLVTISQRELDRLTKK